MKTLSNGSRSSMLKDFKYAPTQFPLEEFHTDTYYIILELKTVVSYIYMYGLP